MSVDRVWLFWHSIVSESIHNIIINGVPEMVKKLLPEDIGNSLTYKVCSYIYSIGATIVVDKWDYDHHNWPYDDDPPLKFHRLKIVFRVHI